MLDYLWKRQKDFDKNFIDFEALDKETREKLTKERGLYIIGEVMDMIEQVPYKTHRKDHPQTLESNILGELVDIFKYWNGLCLIWGFKPEDILKEWDRKTLVVEQLYRQEYKDVFDREKYRDYIIVDIDGVLADWEGGYAKFIQDKTGVNVGGIEGDDLNVHVSRKTGLTVKDAIALKHLFRESGTEAGGLEPIPGASAFLRRMREDGSYIILMTSRPYSKYKRLMADTIQWLRKHEMEFNAIYFDENKEDRIIRDFQDASFVVEDLLQNANRIASRGVHVFLRQTGYNQGETKQGIVRFKTFRDLEEILFRSSRT